MNLLKTSITAVAIAASAVTASAITSTTFTANFTPAEPIAKLQAGIGSEGTPWSLGGYFADSFTNIKNAEDVLLSSLDFGTWEIISATVKFGFADYTDNGHWWYDKQDEQDDTNDWSGADEKITATAQGKDVGINNVEVNGTHPSSTPGSGYDNKTGTISDDDFGGLEDGVVEFKVKAEEGNTYLKTAMITIEVQEKKTPPPYSVPDSGTNAALLGFALVTLAAIRRKLA